MMSELVIFGFCVHSQSFTSHTVTVFQFATYKDGNLQVASTPAFPRTGLANLPVASPCSANGCTNCLQPARGITLAYKPGDLVIAALVSAHERDQEGLECGEVIPDRLIDVVAARYGVNKAATLSRGVSMGYLIVDVCPGEWDLGSWFGRVVQGWRSY